MGSCSHSPHVIVMTVPAQGHVNAALDFSRKLAALDVFITFVSTEARIANLTSQGFDAGGLPIRLRGLPDSLPSHEKNIAACLVDAVDQIAVAMKVASSLRPALQDMLAQLKNDGGVACIVYDFTLLWVPDVGKEFQIPAYTFQPFSSIFNLYIAHVPDLVSQGRLPLGPQTDVNDKSNVFQIPGLPPLHVSDLPNISWDPNNVCSFERVVEMGSRWQNASGMLLNSVYEVEREVIDELRHMAPGMDIKTVGPVLSSSFLEGESERTGIAQDASNAQARRCLEWLDEQPSASVLYVAFGTIACLSEAQTQELAMGLEASKERFLWVIRIQGSREGEHRSRLLPQGFEERVGGRGFLLWEVAPQKKILSHAAVGAFLSHCGWNSIVESMCRGVPILCWPMFSDQSINAKWVDTVARTGKLLKKSVDSFVSKKEVEAMVREVLSPSPLREAAARVREVACHAALHPCGSSSRNLREFVEKLKQQQQV